MLQATIQRFEYLLDIIPRMLKAIPENEFSFKASENKWSKKEILGHLSDSAANNHQRFIRTQYENIPFIVYDQNKWNALNNYQQLQSEHVIDFWEIFNRHLLEVIKRIPVENYMNECNSGEKKPVTLEWLVTDYVEHMEHHLKQIVNY